MICQKLQRNYSEQRSQRRQRVRYLYALVGNLRDLRVAFGDYCDDMSATGLYLLHVGHYLLVLLVMCGYKENRHAVVDKGDRSVLHLCCRIALGMDIAYLLELQCALKSHRIVPATSQIEEVGGIGVCAADGLDAVVELQHLLNLVRDDGQLLYHGVIFLLADGALAVSQTQSQQGKTCELSCECLCGGHSYLRAHMDVYAGIRLTGYAGAYGVDDTEDAGAFRLRQLYSCQRVGGLTALAYRDDNIGRVDDGIAVTELTGIVDLYRYLAILLYELLADESCVPACSAGYDDEPLGGHQPVLVVLDGRQDDVVGIDVVVAALPLLACRCLGKQTATHAVAEALRLVEDLLEHEVWEPTFREHVNIHVDLVDLHVSACLVEVPDLEWLSDLCRYHLLIVDIYYILRVFNYW